MSRQERGRGLSPGRRRSLDVSGLDLLSLVGPRDVNLRLLEDRFAASVTVRGEELVLQAAAGRLEPLLEVLEALVERVGRGQRVDAVTVEYLCDRAEGVSEAEQSQDGQGEPLLFASGSRQAVRVKTPGQQVFVDAVRDHDLVFAVGPAGTGKTFLAVVMAMDYLKRNLVDRIVLVRPAVEAGEQLGFLPGDLQQKINPYLRPLFDALSDITGAGKIARYLSSGVIEASPLAYMRGRTLNNAFVILDEAQNTTVGQMKMFLTRLGFQSKAVVTGDITQIDLAEGKQSGLVHVRHILQETPGVSFVDLDGQDVVRHPLVRRIVAAFEAAGVEGGA